jgi:hypothetical protein
VEVRAFACGERVITLNPIAHGAKVNALTASHVAASASGERRAASGENAIRLGR